jgi:hypothetical protein
MCSSKQIEIKTNGVSSCFFFFVCLFFGGDNVPTGYYGSDCRHSCHQAIRLSSNRRRYVERLVFFQSAPKLAYDVVCWSVVSRRHWEETILQRISRDQSPSAHNSRAVGQEIPRLL